MKIMAKMSGVDGSVYTVELNEDPSDVEIIKALGGTGEEFSLEVGMESGWEIHALPNDLSKILVIGVKPFIDADPKRRPTCNLTDDQVRQIHKNHIKNTSNRSSQSI